MKLIFSEVKASKGGDIGIQIDMFGNFYLYRSIPNYELFLDESDKESDKIKKEEINRE